MALRRRLSAITLILLAAAAAYGFFHEHLLDQSLWTHLGRVRFFLYAAVYWTVAGAILWRAPRWLGALAAIFVFIYTIWWSGPVAPVAVVYFAGSCLLLGRILWRETDAATAILLGLAAWIFALWVALHFPVNTRPVYMAAFAIPYAWEARRLRKHLRGLRWLCVSRAEAAGLSALLFLLMAHWLIALQPEVGSDALSMHLALPMTVAHSARWPFDFRHYTWSLMPSGGDCVFTAAYLLAGAHGGEAAARLANFALLALIAAMIVGAVRRLASSAPGQPALPEFSPAMPFLAAALFVSTPLVQLVTGSLFVENVWAALVLGAVLALVRYEENGRPAELAVAGALFGAALSVKLIAAVFLAPAAVIAVWVALRRRQMSALAWAVLACAVLAAPPYLYAWVKSGNPIFPFANTVFRSPYFDTHHAFEDVRFAAPLSWRAAYDATFRSSAYFEGQAGSAGFQYFLLLLPAALLVRRRALWLVLGVAAAAALLLFAFLPNLRYFYPALPLFSIVIACLFYAAWGTGRSSWAVAAAVGILVALNCWFLSSSGWYHRDFAIFDRSQVASYLAESAPSRALIEHLNRSAPGRPVAFFSTDAVAGLNALAYTDNWHTNTYWQALLAARKASDIAALLRERGIRHIVAPSSLHLDHPLVETFLRQWAEPANVTSGSFGIFLLRDAPVIVPPKIPVLPPGSYDDLDSRIEYTGAWLHDSQWPQTANHSVTYSATAGDSLRFLFHGSGITYVFTKALNRGVALVSIDGTMRARLDEYSPATEWQSRRSFDGLTRGEHSFEVRVLGRKQPRSSGTFVDLDEIVVQP